MSRSTNITRTSGAVYSQSDFGPGDVARITGLSPDLQRVWRRRGYLHKPEGVRARFKSLEVAEWFVRYRLSMYGVPPNESAEIGTAAANIALWFGLLSSDGSCEVKGTSDGVESFLDQFSNNDELASEMTGFPDIRQFLWSSDGSPFVFAADIAEVFTRADHVAICSIDLAVLGTRLAETAGQPLVRIELPTDGSAKIIRRLNRRRQVDQSEWPTR